MCSAFLVFDLIGRNAGLESKRNARSFIHPKFDDREEAVACRRRKGLIEFRRGKPRRRRRVASQEFCDRTPVAINTHLRVLTSLDLGLGRAAGASLNFTSSRRS